MKIERVLIGFVILLAACNGASTKKTPNGFEFKVVESGSGPAVKKGQILVYNLLIKDEKDSVWRSSYERGIPETAFISPDSSQQATEDGVTQMFRMLSKGDSVSFDLTAKRLFSEFAKQPVPPGLDSGLVIHYHIKVTEVLNQEEFEPFREKLMKEYMAKQEKLSVIQLGKDTVAIDEFLKTKNIQAKKLPSGIRYVITKPGTGTNVASGQTVDVEYAGYLLNGTYFDTNNKTVAQQVHLYDSARDNHNGYKPFQVIVDQTQVIPGWHQSLKQLSKGGKGTFYIPSSLAYGASRRSEVIKENSILVFDIEIIDVK